MSVTVVDGRGMVQRVRAGRSRHPDVTTDETGERGGEAV